MTLKKSELLEVIQAEINWSRAHLKPTCGRTPSAQQKIGFIKGLRYAKRLIAQFQPWVPIYRNANPKSALAKNGGTK